jgi:hypothetical protein
MLTGMLVNARSLRRKIDLWKLYVHDNNCPSIIGVTESWLFDDMPNALLDVPGYVIFRSDRPADDARTWGGGVLLYVKHSLNPCPFNGFSLNPYPEMCHCIARLPSGDTILIMVAYRSHSNDVALNHSLYECIGKCTSFGFTHVLLLGDFNFKDISWHSFNWPPPCDEFMDSVIDAGLFQHVHIPTRGSNTLDLVFSNDAYSVDQVHTDIGLGRGDHLSIKFSLAIECPLAVMHPPRRSIQSINWTSFKNDLQLCLTAAQPNLETHWKFTHEAMLSCLCKHAPLPSPRPANVSAKPMWADNRCYAALKNQRTRLRKYQRTLKPTDHKIYLAISDVVIDESRRAKFRFESKLAENIKSDVKSFWKYVNTSRTSRPRIGPFLKPDGSYSQSDQEAADMLASYFASVYTVESTPPPTLITTTSARIDSVTFDAASVSKAIAKMKSDGSPGPDGLPPAIYKQCSDILAPRLATTFQHLLDTASVPDAWLVAHVVPIHKSGSTNDPANFRPISLTCNDSKLMESTVADALICHALEHNLLFPTQFGFLPRRSCMLQLIEFVDWLATVVNDKDCADVVYLDLRKAFDRVPKRRLLAKLKSQGVCGTLLKWLDSFLSNRSQSVLVNGTPSTSIEVTSGVPQGSVLGPVLFLYYINDIDLHVSSGILKFADDTKLFRRLHVSHPASLALDLADMQSDLNSLTQWCDQWMMEFNVKKCACLHFGHNNPCQQYFLGHDPIPNKSREKDLGVIISDSLKFSDHCSDAVRRAEYVLWCIRRSIQYMSKPIFLQLYKTLVRPILEYCSSVWCPHYVRDVQLIEKVQRRATKLHGPARHLDYDNRLRLLGIQSLATRRYRSDLILLYKIVHGLVDLPVAALFDFARDSGVRGHILKLQPRPAARVNSVKSTFAYRVISHWNQLPENVVCAPSVAAFKSRLHDSGALPDL